MKKLTAKDVRFTVTAEQDCIPVRGNALASGNAAMDRETEDEIIARLNRGDVWAWACVIVEAHYRGLKGLTSMGACSYEDEADFRADGYFADMCEEALDDLNRQREELCDCAVAS